MLTHPTYSEMITESLFSLTLHGRGRRSSLSLQVQLQGVHFVALRKHILKTYFKAVGKTRAFNSTLLARLRDLTNEGKIKHNKNNRYQLIFKSATTTTSTVTPPPRRKAKLGGKVIKSTKKKPSKISSSSSKLTEKLKNQIVDLQEKVLNLQ
eukprot:Pgem_evm1s1941